MVVNQFALLKTFSFTYKCNFRICVHLNYEMGFNEGEIKDQMYKHKIISVLNFYSVIRKLSNSHFTFGMEKTFTWRGENSSDISI